MVFAWQGIALAAAVASAAAAEPIRKVLRAERGARPANSLAERSAGNAAFWERRYEEAAAHYSVALQAGAAALGPAQAAVLHCDRAAAHQACGRFLHALADCYQAEALHASCAGMFWRRADVHWELGMYGEAAQVCGKDTTAANASGTPQPGAASHVGSCCPPC